MLGTEMTEYLSQNMFEDDGQHCKHLIQGILFLLVG